MQYNILWHLFEKFSTFIINLIVYMAVFKYDLVVFQLYDFIKRNTMFTQTIYSFSLLCRLALGLVTLMASQAALSTMALSFLEETTWAITASAAFQVPWRCGWRTARSHWPAYALSSCFPNNQCWASRSGPWIFHVPYCRFHWVSANSI